MAPFDGTGAFLMMVTLLPAKLLLISLLAHEATIASPAPSSNNNMVANGRREGTVKNDTNFCRVLRVRQPGKGSVKTLDIAEEPGRGWSNRHQFCFPFRPASENDRDGRECATNVDDDGDDDDDEGEVLFPLRSGGVLQSSVTAGLSEDHKQCSEKGRDHDRWMTNRCQKGSADRLRHLGASPCVDEDLDDASRAVTMMVMI
uniref:Secreted protein n=1 Tax=Anopheles atroparvus TaxID=41427 RepID=A0A182IPV0_ANOAO